MKPRLIGRIAQYFAMFIVALVILGPISWMALGVFKRNVEHLGRQPVIIPSSPLEALGDGFNFIMYGAAVPVSQLLLNTVVITLGSLTVAMLLGVLAAYGFVRFRVSGLVLPFVLLAFKMVPAIAIGLPMFVMFRTLGLLDTHVGLILALVASMLPITIWLLRGFLLNSEIALEEAAMVDGANTWQVLFRITLPLAAPGLAAVGLLAFIAAWNEFFYALLLTREQATTLPAVLPLFLPRELAPGQPISGSFLLALLSASPVVVLALFLQRYLVAGLSLGSVK